MKTTFCGWRILVLALVFAAWAAAFSAKAEAGDPENLAEYLARELGKTQSALAQECVTGNNWLENASGKFFPWQLFDGLSFYDGKGVRIKNTQGWLGMLSSSPYIEFAIPSTSRVKGFTLTSYTVHRLCAGHNSRDRAPTAWTLEGSNDGIEWVTIDSRANIAWGGTQTYNGGGSEPSEADCHQTFNLDSVPAAYSSFRFKPTARSATWDGNSSDYDIGLHELEFFGVPLIAGLQVFHGIDKVEDTSVFPVGNGEYVAAAGTIAAPASVSRVCGFQYRSVGYVLEDVEAGTVLTNLESTAYDYVPEGRPLRLTWLWAFDGMVESFSYLEIVKAYGGTPSYEGGTSGADYVSGTGPDKCFDGVTLTSDQTYRYVGKVGSHVALLVSGLELDEEIKLVPVGYRLWQQSTGWYCNERAPTGWRLEGSTNGVDWVTIDTVDGYTWYSQANLDEPNSKGQSARSPWEKNSANGEKNSATFEITKKDVDAYSAYRLVFTEAEYMKGYTAQQSSGWDAGLMEIEILVKAKIEQATVEVTGAPAEYAGEGSQYGVFLLPQGGRDFSAPEVGFYGDSAALCRGYVLERMTEAGWELVRTNLSERAVHLDGEDGNLRLTWLWENVAVAARVVKDGGEETFDYDPAPDYINAEGTAYYRLGREVRVTPVGVSEPTVSTFTGDIEGDTKGVTVADGAFTFTVDAPRTIKVNFSRHWKFLPASGSEKFARVTDGNWTLYVKDDDANDIGPDKTGYFAKGQHFRTMSVMIGGEPKTRAAGSGRLDLSLLNADMVEQAAKGAKPLLVLATGAFEGEDAITEVIIPEEIVGSAAEIFYGCENLVAVTICSDTSYWLLTTINHGVFEGCSRLQRVSFPRATKLFKYMFKGCKGLEEIKFSTNLTELAVGAFEEAKFESLNLSQTHVTGLPDYVFYKSDFGCISLPEGISAIGKDALVVKDPDPDRLRMVEFFGPPPPAASISDFWSNDNPINTNYKIAIAVRRKYAAEWMATANFVAKGVISGETTLAHYDEVAAYKDMYLGAWRNKWLVVRKAKGLVLIWN